jgi:hypothetical protein
MVECGIWSIRKRPHGAASALRIFTGLSVDCDKLRIFFDGSKSVAAGSNRLPAAGNSPFFFAIAVATLESCKIYNISILDIANILIL